MISDCFLVCSVCNWSEGDMVLPTDFSHLLRADPPSQDVVQRLTAGCDPPPLLLDLQDLQGRFGAYTEEYDAFRQCQISKKTTLTRFLISVHLVKKNTAKRPHMKWQFGKNQRVVPSQMHSLEGLHPGFKPFNLAERGAANSKQAFMSVKHLS
jgi:hypothetical protein